MTRESMIRWLIVAAVLVKLVLFLHIVLSCPDSIFCVDSAGYLGDAQGWLRFFQVPAEGLKHSLYRTPGYPIFLAVFQGGLHFPLLAIVFLQLLLNGLTGFLVYRMALLWEPRAALLSAAIVLLDLPTTIYSVMILTEALHLFLIALFMFAFMKYLDQRRLRWLAGAALALGVSVYVRPVGYFLGFALGIFILCFWGRQKFFTGLRHALIALFLIYGLVGIWQYRNLKTAGAFTLCDIGNATVRMHGVVGRYARETDPQFRSMPPVLYYAHSVGRNFLDLMTTPGNMKYFHSRGWKIFGGAFGYLLVIFWCIGWLAGMFRGKKDVQYKFLMLVLFYFMAVTIVSTGWEVTTRFRIPMVPALAIISAGGWMWIFRGQKG